MENAIITSELQLPGFRFHPTEEELVDYYLKETALGKISHSEIIGFLNIYQYHPWDLPGMAKIGEREWYFFVQRDKRSGHGGKPNRTTEKGYWKATGSDRHIRCLKEPRKTVGLKKTLVFYIGKAPKGYRTDWVMNEYRLCNTSSIPTEDVVLCKIYRKATSLRELELKAEHAISPYVSTPLSLQGLAYGAEREEKYDASKTLQVQNEADSELLMRVESMNNQRLQGELSMDWTLDSIWEAYAMYGEHCFGN